MAAAASPDGRYVLVGDEAGRTILWDLAENTTVELPKSARRRTTVSSVRSTTQVLSASSGGSGGDVPVWDVRSRHVSGNPDLKIE